MFILFEGLRNIRIITLGMVDINLRPDCKYKRSRSKPVMGQCITFNPIINVPHLL